MSTLIYNAKIWRSGLGNTSAPRFYNWILFDKKTGKINSCGTADDPSPSTGEESPQKINLGGRWVFPGFHDAHIHVHWHGWLTSKHTNLDSPKSIEQMRQRLKIMLDDPYNAPEYGNSWFVALGYEEDNLGQYPTAEDLDAVDTSRPIAIYHSGLHIALFNNIGLRMAGVDVTSVPESDKFGVYPAGHKMAGKPNGIIKEAALAVIMRKKIPRSSKLIKRRILSALDDCVRLGITSVHCLDRDCWNEFAELADEGKLPIQCFFSVFYDDLIGKNHPKASGENHGSMLKCSCVKIFTDGALGSDTAALSLPYKKKHTDEKDNFGIMYYTQDQLDRMVKQVDDLGYQLEIHVIGDRAAEWAVSAMEKSEITPDKRPILVHCQVLNQDLIRRMAKLGVVASIQPQNVPADARWVRNKLPEQLQKCMYPYRTMLDNGVICAGSSDSPAYYPNSLLGIHDAIFQPESAKGQGSSQFSEHRAKSESCFQPHERITFTQAVDMYTSDSAKTDFAENELGRLEPGFFANFVVLDIPAPNGEIVDIFTHPETLLDTKVAQTWARGVKLYDSLT